MNLKLRGQVFPILAGFKILPELLKFVKKKKYSKVYLLSDENLKEARKKIARLFEKSKIEFFEIPVRAGESLKDIESVYPIYGELLKNKADRDSVILALGGGSIGDTAGFIASTYLRGIEWIGIPTTLLAQVDSSVGGKTGVNHSAGKNLIGTFHQPSLVICDTQFLATLGPREIASGIGEISKYGITYDPKFFQFLDENLNALLKINSKVTSNAIERSLKFKIKAVESDEYDRKGVREVLNFGHTFGHALETITHYETYQHGEAVIWGMRFATELSVVRGHLPEKAAKKIREFLARIPTPPLPADLSSALVFQTMKKDKKASQNKVRFVLLKNIGKTVSDREVTETDLENAFQRMKR
jgi:3-dehydroquinate synthase